MTHCVGLTHCAGSGGRLDLTTVVWPWTPSLGGRRRVVVLGASWSCMVPSIALFALVSEFARVKSASLVAVETCARRIAEPTVSG